MSCGRLSLLTNVTRDPTDTVTAFGDTPLAVMVIVAPLDPPGEGVGVGELGVLSLPPHAAAASASTIADGRV
jgi:hypothetical protein